MQRNTVQGSWNEIWLKAVFCQIYVIFWETMVQVVIDRYFTLFLKDLKIFQPGVITDSPSFFNWQLMHRPYSYVHLYIASTISWMSKTSSSYPWPEHTWTFHTQYILWRVWTILLVSIFKILKFLILLHSFLSLHSNRHTKCLHLCG